jgi:acid phosphatase
MVSFLFVLLTLAVSCGGGSSGNGGTGTSPAGKHVAVVIFENQDYSDIIGNGAMPYLNGLAEQGALASQFYANAHPSIGNYFMLTTGQLVSTDDNFADTFRGDNVITEMISAGKTWRAYAESLPNSGYVDGDQYPYIKHHNPFAYFENVRSDAAQRNNIVPLAHLSSDLAAGTLPDYFFVVPNNLHNGHDCPVVGSNCSLSDRLGAVDSWLQSNLGPVLSNSALAKNGILIITFDESATDNSMGGGRIATVFTGGLAKKNFQSSTTYQFPSLLRFTLKTLGIASYPGAAAEAPDMSEFLQ